MSKPSPFKSFKNGFAWEYHDDGKEFDLTVDKVDLYPKEYASLNLKQISKKQLMGLSEYEDEKNIGSLTLYLYKKELKGKKLKITYNFSIKFRKGKYLVNVATNTNTYIKENEEILEHNGLKEVHRNCVGMTYPVDIKQITGEDRKSNKLI